MEILDAGAFINLENQEKIDQLKYTATELAKAALETNGFVNEEEPARNLALEFWQGLEYMCRETERGAIQNIFVGQFLDYLRDLRPSVVMSENPSTDEKVAVVSNPEHQPNQTEDEFLGVLPSENQVTEILVNHEENQVIPIFANDSPPTAQVPAEDDSSKEQIEISLPLQTQSEPHQPAAATGDLNQNADFRDDDETESEEIESEEFETEEAEEVTEEENKTTAATVEGGIILSEKEPYQFNKCTVTATVQLLPVIEDSGLRRVVLSVRTHDFAPDISLVEISAADLTATLASELEKVFAKYQANLPFKVMDKMKKEKTVKQKPKTVTESKAATPATTNPKQVTAAANTTAKITESSLTSSPQPPPIADTGGGVQGTLFGF